MGDDVMNSEYPDQDQRAAVCQRQWAGEDKAIDQLDLEVKLGEPGEDGTFEGVASVFGEADQIGDIVAPGAFRKSLAAHTRAGRRPLMLWMHMLDQPIGVWTSIRETADGLRVKGRLLLDTVRGREAYSMLKAKAVDGLSIGFRTVKATRTRTGRLLQEIDLAEISLVSLPALPSARVHSVKTQPRHEPARPMKDTAMTINIAAPDEPDEQQYELPPEVREQIAAIETKVSGVTEMAARLDRIETRLARPGARIEARDDETALQNKAFLKFCRKGMDSLSDMERKVLTVGTQSPDPAGWATVPETFLRELVRNLVEVNPMRQVARVQTVSGGPVVVPKRTDTLTAAWVAETVEHGVSEPSYVQQSVGIFEARVTVEVSNQLLEDSAFDLGAELARDFAEEFGRLEGGAFVSGNGTTEPEGFLTSADFVDTADTLDADGVIDVFYRVPSQYASRGTWLMNRATMGAVRKFRSAVDGPYIWADTLVPGQPATLLGRPVLEMPSLASAGGSPASVVAAFGDWSAFRIFDRVGLEILRDPYTKAMNSIVRFHARKRVGSALVLPEAVAGLSA